VDQARKRELKHAYKRGEQAAARRAMVLDRPQLNDLLDFLDRRLRETSCDHTLRQTHAWATANDLDPSILVTSVRHFGAYYDCEIVANVDPESIF
jgi:Protein of unknown function (DUF2695)